MKIYVLDALHPSGVEYAEKRAEVIRWSDPRVKNWHEDADGVMVRGTPIRAADLARAKKLRVISKQGVGIDNIDVAAARAHGVTVCRTPGVNSEAVAELALTLGLCVTRRVAEFNRRIHDGEIVERANILGLEMMEKTVGIIGMGNIGTRVARKWRGAFDARILAYDPYVPANHWPDIQHERVASLADMLPRVDLDINFETGSWQITPDQMGKLDVIARALNRAIDRNPREVFLIEGHTDAVGADDDNLSLSDRRAESVAVALTQEFGVPPENLITQGYGEQELKVPTMGPSRENRRVAVRRITPLIDRMAAR